MRRINGPGIGPNNSFQPGNPAQNIEPTTLKAIWCQELQEEVVSLIEFVGLTPSASTTQLREAIGLLTGARPGLLNLLINGDFAIWQRDGTGAGVSTAVQAAAGEKFGPDRWFLRSDGSTAGAGALVSSQVSFTPGQTDVPGNPTYFLRIQQTVASSVGPPILGQRIEDVMRFHARQLTVHLRAKAAAPAACSLIATQKFGTGGSADAAAGSLAINLTTDWQQFVFTFTTPSIAGKTVGPGSSFQVHLQMPQGVTGTIEIAEFQCEPSATASPFDRRPMGDEIARCKRFYQKSWAVGTPRVTVTEEGCSQGAVQNNISSPNDRTWSLNTRFPVEMRTTPTVTWFSPAGTVNKIRVYIGSIVEHTVSATLASSSSATGYPVTDFLAGSGAYIAQAHWEADAEL